MIILALTTLSVLWSNGCLFDEVPDARIGAFQPTNASKATLEAETLSVILEGDSARVRARYTIRNDGDTLKGSYGAPIDFEPPSEMVSDQPWEKRTFSHAAIALDGLPSVALKAGAIGKGGASGLAKRRWFSAPLTIGPGRHVLELDVVTSASFSSSTNKDVEIAAMEYSPRTLHWDLSPASHWGTGAVGEFLLTVDASALEKDSIRWSLKGLPLERRDGLWTCRRQNLPLAKAADLRLVWRPEAAWRERDNKSMAWTTPKWRASSELSAYPLANLSDGNLATAWVAPAGDKSPWLEVEIPPKRRIEAMVLCGGYYKTAKTMTENDAVGNFVAKLYKGDSTKILANCQAIRKPTDKMSGYCASTDLASPRNSMPARLGECSVIRLQGDPESDEKGGRLRIEFGETFHGTRSRDLAISEIQLLAPLAK